MIPLKYTFGEEGYANEQTLILPSTWLKQKQSKSSLLKTTDKMAQIDLDLTLSKPGLLSVIIATHFSDMNVYLNLKNRKTN